MTIQIVKHFLEQEGSIGVVDHEGVTRMLHPALPEYLGVAQTANHLWHDGTWHSQQDFLKLCAKVPIKVSS